MASLLHRARKLSASLFGHVSAQGGVAGPALLTDLDFSAPVAQTFPATAAAFASAAGDVAATPSYIWLCDESSGNLVDEIASEPLVPAGTPLQNQTTLIYNGSSYSDKKGVETLGSTDAFEASDTSLLDPDASTSIALLVVFRARETAAALSLFGKGLVSVNTGLHVVIGGGTGFVTARLGDGVTTLVATDSANTYDGAPHCALVVVDRTSDRLRVFTESGGGASTDISTVGSASTARGLYLGRGRFGAAQMQVAAMYAFEGAAAEALDQTTVDNFWAHASDPTGLLTTQTRASLISREVEAGRVAHFADDTLPIGYNPNLTSGYALRTNSATTNLIAESEDITTWTTVGSPTVTGNAGDAPDGFRSATSVVAGAANDQVYYTFTTTAATQYTIGVKLKRVGGSDVSGRVIFYDETGAAELASTVFSATSDYGDWVTVTATTNGGQVSSSIRVEVDTIGEGVYPWGAQANLGASLATYARTSGGTSTLAVSDYSATGDLVYLPSGEIEATWVPVFDSSTSIVFSTSGAADERLFFYTGIGVQNLTARVYNSAGAIETLCGTTGGPHDLDEHTFKLLWDADVGVDSGGYEAVGIFDGSRFNGEAFPWEGSASAGYAGEVFLGRRYSGGDSADLDLQRVRVWNGVVSL